MINPEEIGELVYLRPLEIQDIGKGWLDWVNNPDTSSELTSIDMNTQNNRLAPAGRPLLQVEQNKSPLKST